MQARLEQIQRIALSPDPWVRRAALGGVIVAGAAAIALFIGVAGPLLALATAVALTAAALILLDTHWGFVGLAGVVFIVPFATLPFDIGFKPSFLDLALGGLFLVWVFKLAIGREREFLPSPLGPAVGLFMLLALFSFALGMSHSAANSFIVRRFAEILLGISLYFVVVNTVRSRAEVIWVTRWLMLAGWGAALIAVGFYLIPE
ncbi:MAG: hypothetical protein IT329_15500, partial [Caldilineaceae bacterium]|nr:hypothetical protein [Caldilineaceae bacterium]